MFTHFQAAPLVVRQYGCQVKYNKKKFEKKSCHNIKSIASRSVYNNENKCDRDRCIENMLKSE